MNRELREECGVFGVYGVDNAAERTFFGLYALQHRGEESCGMAVSDGEQIAYHRGMGLVSDVLTPSVLSQLPGRIAIGHVRYSTTGASKIVNAQPIVVNYAGGQLAIGHNGNLVNAASLRRQYEERGSIFQTTCDSEIIVHMLARPDYARRTDCFAHCLNQLRGSFSLVMMTPRRLIAARDPNGFRPLSLGRLDGGYVVASETCAFAQIEAQYWREVQPGEIVFCDEKGVESHIFCAEERIRPSYCIFEIIYFARPDSMVFGQNVHEVRKRFGMQLAKEHPVEADVVIPVPDGGNSAAIGYSAASGIPLDFGFMRNHYIGRTFIQADQRRRSDGVKIKLSPIAEVVRNKRVVVIEDSIVRGTTSRGKLAQLREAGAREIHLRVTAPPHRFPCWYGIDFQAKRELIAAEHSVEEIRRFLRLDSLGYLSVEGMLSCVSPPPEHYCVACFTGAYPVPPECEVGKHALERAALTEG